MANDILAKMVVQISANNAAFSSAMKQSQAQMRGFQKTAQTLNTALSAAGLGLGISETIRIFKYGIGVISDFEKSMSEVKAITGANDLEFKALRDSALELGRTTLFTAKEVSELQVAFGRLGFSNSEILNATEATLQLAAATGEDLAKSADIAGSTLRAFNLDAGQMQRVVDVMAASFNKSALGLDNFGEAMKYVAPVAASANIPLEEVTALLGVLADNGIRGSQAGTSLRKIISDVGKESGTLSERLNKLAAKGLNGADAMDEVGRTAYASLLILTKHIDKVNEAADAYQNVTGEAKKMSELMSDNLAGDVKKLTSAMDGFILAFSDGASPLRDIVQDLTAFINLLSSDVAVSALKSFVSSAVPFLDVTRAIAKTLKEAPKSQKELDYLGPSPASSNGIFDLGTAAKQFGLTKAPGGDATNIADLVAEWDRLNKKQAENPLIKAKTGADFLFDSGVLVEMANAGANAMDTLNGALEVNSNAWDVWWAGVQARTQLAADAFEKHREEVAKLAEVATTVGSAIGDAFEEMISGTESFATALAKVTEEIIELFLKQSIAAMIAASIKDPSTPFPLAKVALAAVGIGVIKGLFSHIGGSSAGAGGGGSAAPGRAPSEMTINVGGRIRGYDLAIVGLNEGSRSGRLG